MTKNCLADCLKKYPEVVLNADEIKFLESTEGIKLGCDLAIQKILRSRKKDPIEEKLDGVSNNDKEIDDLVEDNDKSIVAANSGKDIVNRIKGVRAQAKEGEKNKLPPMVNK